MHRLSRRTALAACVSAAALMGAAPAHAGCGGVKRVMPAKRVVPNMAPLVVGDSVLLGAMPEVSRQGFEVNAQGCRSWNQGVRYLWGRRHAHRLPHEVVMQLGTNWSITTGQIRRALDITGHRRVLVILTPREVGGSGGSDAAAVRRAGRRYPGRVLVLDWVRHTRGRGGWFAPDGIHLTYAGAAGLARFLRVALPYAKKGAAPPAPAT